MLMSDYQESQEPSPLLVVRKHLPVVGVDGSAGHAEHVLLGAEGRVRGLTVRLALRRRPVLLPLRAVTGADEDAVSTPLGRDDIHALEEVDPDHAPNGSLLGAGQTAVGWDGKLGPVILVLVDRAAERVSAVAVSLGPLDGRVMRVQPHSIRGSSSDYVWVDLTREAAERLPEYRTDWELTADVEHALRLAPDIDVEELRLVQIRARDGVVVLSGLIPTPAGSAMIEALAGRVRGVLAVQNRLASTAPLEGRAP
jgi:hypothetical protein